MSNNNQITDGVLNYFENLREVKPLTKEEEHDLLRQYHENGNLEARNRLLTCNLKYACNLASRYVGKGLEYDELISEANTGLIDAIDKFDYKNNDIKLICYAKFWIIHNINLAITKKNKESYTDFDDNRLSDDYSTDYDTDVDGCKSNYNIIDNSDGNSIFNEDGEILDEHAYIEKLTSCLSKREADIVYMYYGVDNKMSYTLEDIAQKYGLTKERVRQIIEKSFKKLRSEAILSETD